MLCKSNTFCPSCSQCPQCCHRTECRGKVTKVLASLASYGRKSSGDFCLERGLHPSIDKVSPSSKWLCQSSKEPVLKGSLTQSHEQVGSRKGGYQVVSGFLQPESGPGDSTVQWTSSQEPQQSESACLAPRISAIKKQGFSDEAAERIEAPQRGSTRAVYKSKWVIFVTWCESHEVDFRSPSVNQIADFLLHLFKERNLQPSTIEGYRTAIADMVGNV